MGEHSGLSHDVSEVWHVQSDGTWYAVQFDGYGIPVTAEVNGHWVRVQYAHRERSCATAGCAEIKREVGA